MKGRERFQQEVEWQMESGLREKGSTPRVGKPQSLITDHFPRLGLEQSLEEGLRCRRHVSRNHRVSDGIQGKSNLGHNSEDVFV